MADLDSTIQLISIIITLLTVVYEIIGALSKSNKPSTILQIIFTSLGWLIYKLTGYIWSFRLNKLKINQNINTINKLDEIIVIDNQHKQKININNIQSTIKSKHSIRRPIIYFKVEDNINLIEKKLTKEDLYKINE